MERISNLLPQNLQHLALSSDDFLRTKIDFINKKPGNLTGYDCKKCLNKGYTAEVRDDTEFMVQCECVKIRETLKRIERSGLKKRLHDCTFDKFETSDDWQRKLKAAVIEFVKEYKGKWLFIGGQSGSGKTHLCTAAVGKLILAGNSAKYMLWREDSVRLKHKVNSDDYEKDISEYQKTNILYIDDLFKGNVTYADIQLAFQIIDYRGNNKLTTVISSEMTVEEITEADEALGGRIAEMAGKFMLNIQRDRKRNYRFRKEQLK